jgi:molybdopterin/thiamine biosynthesis adenylyltransferase
MLLKDEQYLRYSRHLLMADVGEQGQRSLLNSHVLIVGLGGLGCPVVSYLAAAGIGKLSLCDPDIVDITNLQRQVLYKSVDCGKPKADCVQQVVEQLNPEIQVVAYKSEISTSILDQGADIVVDCTDHLAPRALLNSHCYQYGIPLVSASAIGWEGQLIGFDFNANRRLCYNCIIDQRSADPITDCTNAGVVGPVLGVMGSLQATTVVRILLGWFDQHGQIQRYDGKSGQWLRLTANPKNHCSICGGN